MLYVIAGHGDGDCGAVGHGYQEAERVRALAQLIKNFGGDEVMLCDFNLNAFKSNVIGRGLVPKGAKIIELHMDSATPSARGGHVIIKKGFKADKYDIALADLITGMFPGRSNAIVGRNDLANVNRSAISGYNYRLVECGFISNAEDIKIFNSRIEELAKGILKCFGIGVNEAPKPTPKPQPTPTPQKPSKSLDDWANEVKLGKHGNGHANREASLKANGCPYPYAEVRARVNELCSGKTTPAKAPTKTLDEWAREVINGKHGNGHTNRKASLQKAGCAYSYEQVRARVNCLVK